MNSCVVCKGPVTTKGHMVCDTCPDLYQNLDWKRRVVSKEEVTTIYEESWNPSTAIVVTSDLDVRWITD